VIDAFAGKGIGTGDGEHANGKGVRPSSGDLQ